MIQLLAHKSQSGDIYVNLALDFMTRNEWGQAYLALQNGLAKGQLSNPQFAMELFEDVCHRLNLMTTTLQRGDGSLGRLDDAVG